MFYWVFESTTDHSSFFFFFLFFLGSEGSVNTNDWTRKCKRIVYGPYRVTGRLGTSHKLMATTVPLNNPPNWVKQHRNIKTQFSSEWKNIEMNFILIPLEENKIIQISQCYLGHCSKVKHFSQNTHGILGRQKNCSQFRWTSFINCRNAAWLWCAGHTILDRPLELTLCPQFVDLASLYIGSGWGTKLVTSLNTSSVWRYNQDINWPWHRVACDKSVAWRQKAAISCLPFHRSTVRSISSKLWSYDGDVGSSFGSANFSKYLRVKKKLLLSWPEGAATTHRCHALTGVPAPLRQWFVSRNPTRASFPTSRLPAYWRRGIRH